MRIDKLLWFLRLAKTRSLAQAWVEEGHIRVNGRRVERSAHSIATGDVLTLPVHGRVRVIELVTIPARRGPAPEAQACYRALDEFAPVPVAGGPTPPPSGTPQP